MGDPGVAAAPLITRSAADQLQSHNITTVTNSETSIWPFQPILDEARSASLYHSLFYNLSKMPLQVQYSPWRLPSSELLKRKQQTSHLVQNVTLTLAGQRSFVLIWRNGWNFDIVFAALSRHAAYGPSRPMYVCPAELLPAVWEAHLQTRFTGFFSWLPCSQINWSSISCGPFCT